MYAFAAHTTWRINGASGSICSASIWPLTGRTGGLADGGTPAIPPDQAPAANTTMSAEWTRSAMRKPSARPFTTSTASIGVSSWSVAPGCDECAGERRDQEPIVDLVVVGTENRGREMRREVGFALARLGAGEPFERDAERTLEIEIEFEPRRVVARERHHQRALAPQPDRHVRGPLQFGGEVRPEALAFAIEGVKRLLARFGLESGSQHPGGGPARAAPGLAALEDIDGAADLRQAPADAQADGAAADNGDARGARSRAGLGYGGLPSLA